MRAKLLAFAVSSFYCGVAGALFAYAYLGTVEPEAYNLDLSFRILFMIIIGGVGTVLGAFLGSAFIALLPIAAERRRALPRQTRCTCTSPSSVDLEPRADGVRRTDHLLPDRRAARSRADLADHEGEAAAVAVPALEPLTGAGPSTRAALTRATAGQFLRDDAILDGSGDATLIATS